MPGSISYHNAKFGTNPKKTPPIATALCRRLIVTLNLNIFILKNIADLVSAHLLALEALGAADRLIYNVGSGRGFSVREVIETARKVTGHPIPVLESARRAGDPARLVASSEKIRKELGWKPLHTELQDIIASAWDWHKSHPKGYGSR